MLARRCSGECAKVLDEDDEYRFCFDTRTGAEKCAGEMGWEVTETGEVYCPLDAPDDAKPIPLEIPGQLALDGTDC